MNFLTDTLLIAPAPTEAAQSVNFEPGKFIEMLPYMGIGMLGVFLIVGIIIVATGLIGKLTGSAGKGNE